MANLNTQTGHILLVINFVQKIIDNNLIDNLKNWLENNTKQYAFILHDKDILEDGTPKTPHLHAVCNMNSSKQRIATILNDLTKSLDISPLLVTIDKYSSFNSSIQYLIHKNNEEKYQYDLKDIVTNIPRQELDLFMKYNTQSEELTAERLIDVVRKANKRTDIMREVGLFNYRINRPVIMDIAQEFNKIW